MNTPVQPNWVDRLVEVFSPARAAARVEARRFLASYRGGVPSRMDRSFPPSYGTSGWNHPLAHGALTNLRDKARHLDRNNCLASSLLDRATENVVGPGHRLQARTKSTAWNEKVEKRFERWQDEADVRRLESFNDLQQRAYRTKLLEGDIATLLQVDEDGFPHLQMIEGDDIETPPELTGRPRVHDGIRWSMLGAPVTYFVREISDEWKIDYEEIPARDVVYLMNQRRANSVRGEPKFAQSLWLFDHCDGYVEAVVAAARAGACQALLITKNNPTGAFGANTATTKDAAGNVRKDFHLEPTMVHHLGIGEDVRGFNPTQPTTQFSDFISTLARLMGLNLGLTLEQVMLDYSQTNYSSSRAARLQAEATARIEQDRFQRKFLRRIYQWWVSKMVALGEVPEPSDPDDFWAHEWIAEPRPWVDPEKEIKAALIELDMGLTTLTILAKERGREFAELIAKRAEEVKALKAADLPSVMSNQTREPGAAKPAPGAEPAAVGGRMGAAEEEEEAGNGNGNGRG